MLENACGGQRWDMRPDGLIEVEGEGTPAFDPGSVHFEQMAASWNNWSGLILDAAGTYGLPPAWILSIMTEETGLWSDDPQDQATKVSYAGARGLMQIMPATARLFGADPADMFDPKSNIDVGAALLADLSERRHGQLPEMAAAYNSGSVCSPGKNRWNLAMADDYAGNVIKWNNAAVMYMSLRRPRLLMGVMLGAAGLYAAALIAGLTKPPRQLARLL
jgi:soluble lytic murein transglycosylase-like protein